METKKTIIRRLIPLLSTSTMSYKERMMWLIMMPVMPEKLLLKLEKAIEEESQALANLYVSTLSTE